LRIIAENELSNTENYLKHLISIEGVVHGDELLMMFTNKNMPIIKHPDNIKVSNTLIDPRYNRKGTLSGIPKTGGCLVKGPKIPRQVR
jgi:hypothetical protein